MRESLDVLVVEADRGVAAEAVRALEAAGHNVLRCRRPGGAEFPCFGVVDPRGCPFERAAIAVALTMRRHPRPKPTLREIGAICALRRRIPLVVAGRVAFNPFEEYACEVVDGEDVVSACERAAA